MSAEPEPRLVAGKLSAIGAALAITGFLRRSPLLMLAGGLAIGLGLRLES